MTALSTVVTPGASRVGTAGTRRGRPGWTLALAGMGAFISALDIVVVATALPMAMPVLAPGKERTV